MSGNEDGDAGPFSAPACPGHRGHFGGGNPPPPTVPPMQHAGPLLYVKRMAPCYCTMRRGGGAEEKAVNGGGICGEIVESLSGLWRTFGNVTAFRYLGRVMTADDDDWPSVVGNLQKARKIWG